DIGVALLRIARPHLLRSHERRPATVRPTNAATGRVHTGGAAGRSVARRDRDRTAHASRATDAYEGRLGRALAIVESAPPVAHRRARDIADASDQLHR